MRISILLTGESGDMVYRFEKENLKDVDTLKGFSTKKAHCEVALEGVRDVATLIDALKKIQITTSKIKKARFDYFDININDQRHNVIDINKTIDKICGETVYRFSARFGLVSFDEFEKCIEFLKYISKAMVPEIQHS